MAGSETTRKEYDNLEKPELIAMVNDLNARITVLGTEKTTATAAARFLARFSLAMAVFLIPARYRILLISRPIPPIYKDYTDLLLFASDVAVLCVIGFWLLSFVLEPDRQSIKLTAKPLFLTIPLAGIVLFSAISIVFSIDPLLSSYHTLRFAGLFLLYLYAIQENNLLSWVFFPAGASLLIQSSVGIAQIFKQSSLGLVSIGELELNPDWSGVSIVWAEGIRSLRAYGLSDHPNILGGCLTFALLICILWLLTTKVKRPDHWGLSVIAGLIFLGGTALFLTYSRSAWLSLIAGTLTIFLLLFIIRDKKAWHSLLGLIIGGMIAIFPFVWHYAPYLSVRLNYQGSFSAVGNEFRAINERRLLNASSNDIFARHALTGVGLGAYPQALKGEQPDFPIDYQPAHIALVAAAADIGLFGASAYAVALAAPWAALGAALWKGNRNVFTLPLIGLSGLLMAITLVGAFDYYTWLLAPGRLWQWLAWGLWGAVYQSSKQGDYLA